jgi:hypothetical protein
MERLAFGAAFEVHGLLDVEGEPEEEAVEVGHGVGGAGEEEEETAFRVDGQGGFAPAFVARGPDVLPAAGDEAEVLDDEVVLVEDRGLSGGIEVEPEAGRE